MSQQNKRPQLDCARPSRCTWKLGTEEKDPHYHKPLTPIPKIVDNVLECIGRTPLVRLNRLPKKYGLKCEVLAKCEYFNAGGSVKDRIGLRMIEEYERKGLIKPGYTLIEPTSGNTGIGIALAAAVKGYKCIIVMPEKMSTEKADVLKLLGAEIVRTPTSAPSDSPDSHIGVAKSLCDSMEASFVLDQYQNEGNPLAHYDGTGEEILQQCDGKVDMVVGGVGTCGTMSGIARKLKEKIPNCKIVGVDPHGSILAHHEDEDVQDGFYEVEGIGYDFYPTVYDKKLFDQFVKSEDASSFKLARELILEEGLLCGGSSGSAMKAVLEVAKDLDENQRVVVILPDGIRNYMSKFVNDEWMVQRNFEVKDDPLNVPWFNSLTVEKLSKDCGVKIISDDLIVSDAIEMMKELNVNQLAVVKKVDGSLDGVVTMHQLMTSVVSQKLKFDDLVTKCLTRDYPKVTCDEPLSKLSRLLKRFDFVAVITRAEYHEFISSIVTHLDVLNFIQANQN